MPHHIAKDGTLRSYESMDNTFFDRSRKALKKNTADFIGSDDLDGGIIVADKGFIHSAV